MKTAKTETLINEFNTNAPENAQMTIKQIEKVISLSGEGSNDIFDLCLCIGAGDFLFNVINASYKVGYMTKAKEQSNNGK